MSADRLREAARVLRERAQRATSGPWEVIGGGEYVQGPGILVAPDDGGITTTDAEYIAKMHPSVALALADLLDAEAAFAARWPGHEQETAGAPEAFRVADQILGKP